MNLLTIGQLSRQNDSVADEDPGHEPEKSADARTTLYPKIFKLTDFLYHARSLQSPVKSIHLTGSVKLHGTHADIVFVDCSDEIRLQSRNKLSLNPGNDNAGFASFIAAIEKEALNELRDRLLDRYLSLNPARKVNGDLVIAGEWCGIGVQKKVAISRIPKFFAIVSIKINESWVPEWDYAGVFNENARIFNIGKAGFFTHEIKLNDIKDSEAGIRSLTDAVEKECPFAKSLGVSGLGEGIVWKATTRCEDPKFWFKSKGDLLAVSNSDKLSTSALDVDNREHVDNLAKAIVTEARLEQGWEYLDGDEARKLGTFLKWVVNDCFIEEKRGMEALNLGRGRLSPAVTAIAKPWFLARIEQDLLEKCEK